MPIGLTPDDTFPHITDEDMELLEENRTVFQIAYLEQIQRAAFEVIRTNDPTRFAEAYYDCVRVGLRGWSNFKDKDGNEIVFEVEDAKLSLLKGRPRRHVKPGLLDRLDEQTFLSLSSAIRNSSVLSDEDRKN